VVLKIYLPPRHKNTKIIKKNTFFAILVFTLAAFAFCFFSTAKCAKELTADAHGYYLKNYLSALIRVHFRSF